MTALRDTARAKFNLTLEVLGRRADGFHEVRSLVAFAELGDHLTLEPGQDLALDVEGPFASALAGDNLITAAAEATKAEVPGIALGRFRLVKALPVAAGLGGGSADAAAALRLLARANPGALSRSALAGIAARLGSDVTACLKSLPALMTGRGEKVTDIRGMPACPVLLVNPGIQLPTAKVYGALDAAPLSAGTDAFRSSSGFQRKLRAADLLCRIARQHSRSRGFAAGARHRRGCRRAQAARRRASRAARRKRADLLRPVRHRGQAKSAATSFLAVHPAWWVAATTLSGS